MTDFKKALEGRTIREVHEIDEGVLLLLDDGFLYRVTGGGDWCSYVDIEQLEHTVKPPPKENGTTFIPPPIWGKSGFADLAKALTL